MNIVLDIGTSGIKVLSFDKGGQVVYRAYESVPKREAGHMVEQDPEEIYRIARRLVAQMIDTHRDEENFALGVTTQRETIVGWNKETGEVLYPAISWQDERTRAEAEMLEKLHGDTVRTKTGLPILPYFSATKMSWLLRQDRVQIEKDAGNLSLGTLDAWIMWKFTGNFYTDVTNASRTLLYNIHENIWDKELCEIFKIPMDVLPDVQPSKSDFGTVQNITEKDISVKALAGDQQSSLFAAGEAKGVTKVTFGSGVFLMQVVGESDTERVEDFFITRTCSDTNQLCVEKKIMRLAEYVTPLLEAGDTEKLHTLLDDVVSRVKDGIGMLPIQPREIIVDGGVTQSEYLMEQLQKHIPIDIKKQVTYDGTALGMERLLVE